MKHVVTFGSPFVSCGGEKILEELGLDERHVHCVMMMHRNIVPRAFSCNYPDFVALILKLLNGSEHLFFQCSFSSSVGQHFINRVNLHPPQSFEAILEWLARPATDQHLTVICRLFYQASMYSIWKERNARLHSSIARHPDVIISDIEDTIKLKLDPLSRTNRYITSSHVTALFGTWLSLF
ncbi:hypothetical protein YC2023_078194 [Brassica napus]